MFIKACASCARQGLLTSSSLSLEDKCQNSPKVKIVTNLYKLIGERVDLEESQYNSYRMKVMTASRPMVGRQAGAPLCTISVYFGMSLIKFVDIFFQAGIQPLDMFWTNDCSTSYRRSNRSSKWGN